MKKYLFIAIIIPAVISCSDWLDVKPESDISKDELFNTEAGFEESLDGIYSRASQSDLYGDVLTFGFLDVLAQNYTIPYQDYKAYLQTSLFNYKDGTFITRKDAVWAGLYNAIANCNLLLENIDEKKTLFTGNNYAIIKGEALALRAYFHFDLLRIFAPSYATPSASAIPYVSSFTNKVTPLSTVEEVVNKVIADFTAARDLLNAVDPILTKSYVVGYPTDKNDTEESSTSLFLQNRRHRLNYYAICGSLARVYMYAGDKVHALENAKIVIDSHKFPWTNSADFILSDPQQKDRILYKELLFAWYIPQMEATLTDLFGSGTTSLYISEEGGKSLYETGGVGAEDLRYKEWFNLVADASANRLELQKYSRDADVNRHYLMAPALRLSEMFYISAEATYDTDNAKAVQYIDSVRFHRGINVSLGNITSKETFLKELVKESRKEFYGEGQIFYMYKRLGMDIVGQSGTSYGASNSIFVLPLPDTEIEYGQR
jgi:starch-binding outer membrane protein, SusD/RagB family